MRLSVACNFDDALLDGLKNYPVYEVYGKVTQDFVGGGRPSFRCFPLGLTTVGNRDSSSVCLLRLSHHMFFFSWIENETVLRSFTKF